MCLGIPGEVLALREEDGVVVGRVRFGGITKDVCLSCVPEAVVGDFVLVHVGFAIARVDREAAASAYRTLEELGLLAELQDGEEPAS
jgi:hydrogenase expression/formation protein HypC